MPNISREELLSQLIAIRHAIRTHRDQVGDYRCWVDDEVLYHRFLPELEGYTAILPSSGEFHSFCVACLLYTSDAGRRIERCRSRWSPYH